MTTHRLASPPPQMLANTPNGKISEALAQIYTKEGISLSKPKGGMGKAGGAAADGGAGAGGETEEEFTPVVYVAKVIERGREEAKQREQSFSVYLDMKAARIARWQSYV